MPHRSAVLVSAGLITLFSGLGKPVANGFFQKISDPSVLSLSQDVLIRPALRSQTRLIEMKEHCCADPDALRIIGRSVGQQARIVREGAGPAIFTIQETRDERPQSIIRIGKAGRDRLGTDGEFPARMIAEVSRSSLTDAEAKQQGEFVERLDDDGRQTGLLILAPHGGEIEAWTDEQAECVWKALSDKPVSAWRCKGFRLQGGRSAFTRWHITSTDIHEASFPLLREVSMRRFAHVVSFHGMDDDGILIGGRAPIAIKKELQTALVRALEGTGEKVRIAGTGESLSGSDPRNIVNRYTEGMGIQIEQSPKIRRQHWKAIADAVVEFYRAKL